MTEIEPNIPLLRKVVEWAEGEAAKPEIDSEWNQKHWVSSPRQVAVDLVGYQDITKKTWTEAVDTLEPHCGTAYCIAGKVNHLLGYEVNPWHTQNVSEQARVELGLTLSQAEQLFHATNTIEDVRCIAEEIAGEAL